MDLKTCIITGANAGIGKAAAVRLARSGCRVILACRNMERAGAVQQEIGKQAIAAPLDLSRRASIHAFTEWVRHEIGTVDVLINNAAEFDVSQQQRTMTKDGFETIWATNHLGPVLLTDRLMDLLLVAPQGRILNVSSMGLFMHPLQTVDLKDPMFNQRPYSVSRAYYQSKIAQMMFTCWLAGRLPGTMVTANCIRVSNVRVDLSRYPDLSLWSKRLYRLKALFSITPDMMADTYVYAATDQKLKNCSGKYYTHPFKEVEFPTYARDLLSIEQVMQLTYRQLGIGPAISFEAG